MAQELTARLDPLSAGDVLLVDLTEVDHLGPAGVWVMDSLARRCRLAGVELRLVTPPGDSLALTADAEGTSRP
jgi:anti-anti-sigma regulatory factor